LLGKLPPGIGRDIIALETEDHYLRVHARGGSALILMRMADAVALLDPRLGAQVHRRWWVAQGAVAGVRTEGQKLSLRLVDGTLVPVGRTFLAAAKARFGQARTFDPPEEAQPPLAR
jgi:DNA-binding LytR/AlgR family response regulator